MTFPTGAFTAAPSLSGLTVVSGFFTGTVSVTVVLSGGNYLFNFAGFTYAAAGAYSLTFYLNNG
jgi:hypothetical protein